MANDADSLPGLLSLKIWFEYVVTDHCKVSQFKSDSQFRDSGRLKVIKIIKMCPLLTLGIALC